MSATPSVLAKPVRFSRFFLFPVLLAGLAVAGCQNNGQGPELNKENVGTVLGAVGGAVLGAQFGKGTGQLVGVAAGALAGAWLGNQIGSSLDKADKAEMEKASNRATTAPVGQTISWRNPDSGNSGTVTPTREGTAANGDYCREFQQTVTVGGKTEKAFGTACRQPDGSWKIVNG
ncbi:RT0821/Lpp0805 family surface protein [Ferrovibrio sp.]|uniref:RT0821/Lpp0805 family surface protein n=1 Tax=Ferrovibrio sp. TaxID=1917215 RepID=UPI00261150FA|nr:RT0821/Lpp0805 family surface protein [Ferrovibrio sp.]